MNLSGKQSFTLVEVLITVGILSIIVGVGFLNLTGFKSKHSFDLDAENVVASIRNTQNRALLGEGGTSWGIRFVSSATGGSYEIFSGTEYAPSSVVVSDALSVSSRFYNPPSGFSKTIVFSPISGLPSNADTIVLGRSSGDDLYIISINALGRVSISYETGLVGYWAFDEGLGTEARDSSLSGNHGTLVNTPTWQSACRNGGSCLYFTNTAHVSFSSSTNIPMENSNYSIAAWIKTDSMGIRGIVGWGNYGVANQVNALRLSGTGFRHYWWANDLDGSTSSLSGVWHHVVAVFDGTNRIIYLDGVELVSDTPSGHNVPNADNLTIAKTYTTEYFEGYIDEVRIYDYGLTPTQVEQLYESY